MNWAPDVDKQDEEGCTALTMAAYYGNLSVVLLLLSAGADPNKATDVNRTPILHLVAYKVRLGFH